MRFVAAIAAAFLLWCFVQNRLSAPHGRMAVAIFTLIMLAGAAFGAYLEQDLGVALLRSLNTARVYYFRAP